MTEEIVGIDLGTTNSEIALYRDGRPDVLADKLGRMILPSVVGVTEAGELLVGEEARNQYVLYPERTIRSIKRRPRRFWSRVWSTPCAVKPACPPARTVSSPRAGHNRTPWACYSLAMHSCKSAGAGAWRNPCGIFAGG